MPEIVPGVHWSAAEWTSVIATGFAAIAAIAAWAAVLLQVRAARAARHPHLVPALQRFPTGAHQLTATNGGPGLAVHVSYLLVVRNHEEHGIVGRGFLRPGEEATVPIKLLIPRGEDPLPMVCTCRDIDNRTHIWSHDGRYKSRSLRWAKRRRPTIASIFIEMYPEVSVP